MIPEKLNRQIQAELATLTAARVITGDEQRAIAARYPAGPWDLRLLVRAFTVLGALGAAGGAIKLAQALVDWRNLLEAGLAAAFGVTVWLGLRLRPKLGRTAAALHLVSGFALQGLVVAFAIHHSTGSKNWPALVGINCFLLLALAYALQNRLVLSHAAVNFFTWFGGSTGYMSGWGAYWLGMNYPLRFALIGLFTLGVAWLHYQYLRGPYQAFSRVYAHFGLLVFNFALWFFSVFGWFEDHVRWDGTDPERLAFSALWALTSAASLLVGSRWRVKIFRSYGLVFLIINLYTFYFQFIVVHSTGAWFLHMLIIGGSMVGLGLWLDRRRKRGIDPA